MTAIGKNRKPPAIFRWIGVVLISVLSLFVLVVVIFAVAYSISNRTNGKIISSGVERRYLIHVPESYTPGNPVPLVISLHGFASWPRNQMDVSQWNELSDQKGFIVVYPSGIKYPKRWRLPVSSFNQPGTKEDVIFLSDLISTLEKDYSIDSRRIFANGLSNGAGMSVVLGCELSDRIAAIGGVAGAYLYPLDICLPKRPVPMIAFHGTDDPIVPYSGGPSHSFDEPFPSISEYMKERALLNGCELTPLVIMDEKTVSGIEFPKCSEDASVIFYTIYGGGHTWPGGGALPEWIAGYTSQAVSATQLMWDFFMEHPLPVQ